MGIALIGFSSDIAIASVGFGNTTDNEIKTYVAKLGQITQERGDLLIKYGAVIIFLFAGIGALLIHLEKSQKKRKIRNISKYPILFDEMYDGKDIELAKEGYDTYSVKKIRLSGEPLQYDYSVLKYVEENKMILITEDPENYGACMENNLPCIKLGQTPSMKLGLNSGLIPI